MVGALYQTSKLHNKMLGTIVTPDAPFTKVLMPTHIEQIVSSSLNPIVQSLLDVWLFALIGTVSWINHSSWFFCISATGILVSEQIARRCYTVPTIWKFAIYMINCSIGAFALWYGALGF